MAKSRVVFRTATGERVSFLAKPAASKRSTKRKPAAKRPKACTCKRGGRR